MQAGGGDDVRAPGAFGADLRAQVHGQVAGAAHGGEAAELREFQRDGIKAAKRVGAQECVEVVGAFVEFHRQARGLAHGGAVFQRGAGLLQHHVEMGDGAPGAGGVQFGRAAVPIAVDQRTGADRFAHFDEAFSVRCPIGIGAKLGLKLSDAGGVGLARDTGHFVGIDAGDGVVERHVATGASAQELVKR